MTTKELAVKEIIKIHKKQEHLDKDVLIALGCVGGEDAIKNILKIHNKQEHLDKDTLKALGEAGKNS